MSGLLIRAADVRDLPAVQQIYAIEVQHGSASFELEPPVLKKSRNAGAQTPRRAYLIWWPSSAAKSLVTPMQGRIGAARHTVTALRTLYMYRARPGSRAWLPGY